jgi:hypothetical protein
LYDQAWKTWFDEDAPEECPIPDGYSSTLDTFRKLLLIRSWCPDRTIPMAKVYVAEAMGSAVSVHNDDDDIDGCCGDGCGGGDDDGCGGGDDDNGGGDDNGCMSVNVPISMCTRLYVYSLIWDRHLYV